MKDKIQKRAEEIGNLHGHGLTKLELFAAMAMQGMLSNREPRYTTCAADAVKYAQSLCVALAEAEKEVQDAK